MKIKFILLFILSAFLSFGLISCSDDDDNKNIEEPTSETPSIEVDNEAVQIFIEKEDQVSINILKGAGEYSVFSLDPEIATASLSGDTINIKGHRWGFTSLIISDKKDQLKVIKVANIYDKVVLEKNELFLEYRLGNAVSTVVPIIKGNGSYKITVEDNEIVKAEFSENNIKVTTLAKEGKTNVIVTDAVGIETKISVETKSTIEPYTDSELESIMAKTTESYSFNESSYIPWEAVKLNTLENDMNLYGWSVSSYHLKIYFPGDKSVGTKQGAKISSNYITAIFPTIDNGDLAVFRIIKNDGQKIWAVFSCINNEKLLRGYFVANINP